VVFEKSLVHSKKKQLKINALDKRNLEISKD